MTNKLYKIIPFLLWVFIIVSSLNFVINFLTLFYDVTFDEYFEDILRKSDFWLNIFSNIFYAWIIINIPVAIIFWYLARNVGDNKKISLINIVIIFQILVGLGSLWDIISFKLNIYDCGILEEYICTPIALLPLIGFILAPIFIYTAWYLLNNRGKVL